MPKTLHDFVSQALTKVNEISTQATADEIGKGNYVILDVREPEEFAAGHIPGSINIPRGFLEVKADLEHYKRDPRLEDRHQQFICYCGGGHRSAMACEVLLDMGFDDAQSMKGGWTAWINESLPVETP